MELSRSARARAEREKGLRKKRSAVETFAMRHKRKVLRIHRWVGCIVGVWAVLQGLSGLTMLAGDQLAHVSHPKLYHHGRGDLGPGPAIAAAVNSVPHAKFAASAFLPTAADGVYRVAVVVDPTTLAQRYVYVDPATARVNGVRDPKAGAAAFASRWHTSLLQSPTHRILGVAPQQVVGWFGVATIALFLLGWYLWYWPRFRRWKRFGRIRTTRGGYTAASDTHRLFGVILAPILLVIVVTGLTVAFPRQARPLWYAITPGRDTGKRADAAGPTAPPPPTSTPVAGAKPIGLDLAVQAAGRALLHSTPVSVKGAAGRPTGAIEVKVSHGWDPAKGPEGKGGNATVYLDQFSGKVLRVVRPEDKPVFAQAYEYWAFAVHTGSFGTPVTRALWSLVVLTPTALFATGLTTVFIRRAKRMRRRRRVRSALPTLTRSQVTTTVGRCTARDVQEGTVIAKQGTPADSFYIVVKGRARVTLANSSGVERELDVIGPGDYFGEIGLLVGGTRTASVTALTPCELLVMGKTGFDGLTAMSVAAHEDLLDTSDQRLANQIRSRLRPNPDRKRSVGKPEVR